MEVTDGTTTFAVVTNVVYHFTICYTQVVVHSSDDVSCGGRQNCTGGAYRDKASSALDQEPVILVTSQFMDKPSASNKKKRPT